MAEEIKKEKHQLEDVTIEEMPKCEDMGKYILETEEASHVFPYIGRQIKGYYLENA